MPSLSSHYAIVTLPNGEQISPISVDVTADETWSPYVQATVVVPSNLITDDIDPRLGTRLKLRLQQDFGDLIYNYELTASYGGSVAAYTAAYAGTQVMRRNLVTNPSFETDATGWLSYRSATLTRDIIEKYVGSASLKVVTTPQSGNSGGPLTIELSGGAGLPHIFSAWVKAPAGELMSIYATNNVDSSLTTNFTATGSWQRVSSPVVISSGTSPIAGIIWSRNTTSSVTFYVDAAMIEASSVVGDYFDGSLPNGLNLNNNWTGTANASTSTQLSGDLVNCQEITRDFTKPWNIFETALPLSTVTTAYSGDVSNITAAGLIEIWRMSDFLHSSGTFNPLPSTIFSADLGVRSIAYDYVSKEATISLSSDEALTQDVHGYGDDIMVEYDDARALINEVLNFISASLQPGDANYSYVPAYQLQKYEFNLPSTAWDFIETITAAAGLKLYCDENRNWYLVDPVAVAGTLALNDTDNITSFTKEISRDRLWYNQVVIQYETISDGVIWDNYYASGTGPIRTLFQKKTNIEFPGMGAAQSIAERSLTRGETYNIEAIANFDARPRQTLTVDITGEPVKTGIVQSVTWSLPSARMSVDIRDLQEVI